MPARSVSVAADQLGVLLPLGRGGRGAGGGLTVIFLASCK